MRIFGAAGALAFASLGCAAAAPPSPAPPQAVTSGDKVAVRAKVLAALNGAGFQCAERKDLIFCDEQAKDRLTVGIVYEVLPARLVFVVPGAMKRPCEEAFARFNKFNRDVDYIALSCEGESFTAVTVLYVPEAGLTAKDVSAFVAWWTASAARAMQAGGIFDFVK
jgi:hypothetical protein